MYRWAGWPPLIVLPAAVVLLTPASWPRWVFMWALAFAIYCGCKWLTWRRTHAPDAPTWRHLAYIFAWPGLDAPAFLRGTAPPPSAREWLFAAAKLGVGLTLLYAVVPHLRDVDP